MAAAKIAKVNISDIVHMLKVKKGSNQSMVLLLGSRAGDLFHSPTLYDMLKGYSRRNFNNLVREEQFAECYKILRTGRFSENEIDTILTASLKDRATTGANICLAELVDQDFFDTIISTNIDTFLESSFKEIGMKELHDFEVFIPERDSFRDIVYSDRRSSCKLIKIFGDLPSRVYNIAKRDFSLAAIQETDTTQEWKNLLGNILARDVLVIGFDPTWDEEILRAFPVQKSLLWLVTEEEVTNKHPLVALTRHGKQVKCMTGKGGESEQFLKALYWQIHEELPSKYQLARDTLNLLRSIRNDLSQLGVLRNEIHEVHIEISDLKESIKSCLEKNGGDVI